jgi:hypothetical protein
MQPSSQITIDQALPLKLSVQRTKEVDPTQIIQTNRCVEDDAF